MRAAVPALGGARRGSAGLALGGGGSGASVQGSAGGAAPPPARPPSPSPRSRSRPGAHFRGLPLGSARGSRAGAGGPGVAGETGTPRSSARAARGADRDAAASRRRLYSPRLSEDRDSGGRPAPGAAPSRTARRPVCAAAPAATRPRESPGRPAQPSSGGGERRGGAEPRPHPPPRPGTCCLCSRRGARSCRRRGRSRPRLGPGDAGPAQARVAARAALEAIHGGRDPGSLLPFTSLVPRERSLGARGGRRRKADC